MPGQALLDRLPSPFPRDDSSDFVGWVDAHQSEVDQLVSDIETVKKSLQIAFATGQSLDLIGADYGRLGRRRGRGDDAYRQYLQSLVPAFDGRGTVPGLKTAISAGVRSDTDDITIIEDFSTQEYEVQLEAEAWAAHSSGTIRELADLADPSVVDFREPVHNILDLAEVGIDVDDTVMNSGSTLATATPTTDAGDTVHETVNSADTFGTGTFDGEDTFS